MVEKLKGKVEGQNSDTSPSIINEFKQLAVIGAQWGDEGKGKVVDCLCKGVDVVVRYQGGNNAGHTVNAGGKRFVFHVLPSGILRSGVFNVIGNGVVVDAGELLAELEALRKESNSMGRLLLSEAATLIMPWHKLLDKFEGGQVGTTLRGIGPAYESKVSRKGFRVGELLDFNTFAAKLKARLEEVNWLLVNRYKAQPLQLSPMLASFREYANKLTPYVTNTSRFLNDALRAGKRVLFEGAQGTLLDVDFGSYPFVTSSNPSIGGVFTGSGVRPRALYALGIVKAYCTRVGNGPFPTELVDKTGDKLRELGNEYGATTGRPRRCGWLDLVLLEYSCLVNGFDAIALTKLDVLTGFERVNVAMAYEIDGRRIERLESIQQLSKAKPIYRELVGWSQNIGQCRRFEDLPRACRDYVHFIERGLGVPVKLIGVGPEREELIVR